MTVEGDIDRATVSVLARHLAVRLTGDRPLAPSSGAASGPPDSPNPDRANKPSGRTDT